MPKRRILQAI